MLFPNLASGVINESGIRKMLTLMKIRVIQGILIPNFKS